MAKKKRLAFTNGVAYIHATANNTIVSIADEKGNVITWQSSGTVGNKGAKKKTPYSAGVAAEKAARAAHDLGLASVRVAVNGVGRGKEVAIRSLQAGGLSISEISDVTPLPHNGCRPPKKPR